MVLAMIILVPCLAAGAALALPTYQMYTKRDTPSFPLTPANGTTFNPHYKYMLTPATELPTSAGGRLSSAADAQRESLSMFDSLQNFGHIVMSLTVEADVGPMCPQSTLIASTQYVCECPFPIHITQWEG